MTLHLIIPGRPQRWQRPENNKGGGRRNPHEAAKRVVRIMAEMAVISRVFKRIEAGPVNVQRVYVFQRPTRCPTDVPAEVWATGGRVLRPSTPDVDNLDKLVFDALNGIAYRDDAQVCCGEAVKAYAAKGEKPHTEVKISRAEWLVEDTCDSP